MLEKILPAHIRQARAEQLMEQGEKLRDQETVSSRQQAIVKFIEALKIWQNLGDRSGEANTLLALGTTYKMLSESQKALEAFNQGLAIWRELKNILGEAFLLFSVGGAYFDLGEKQKALESYNAALQIFWAENQPFCAALTLVSLGQVYWKFGKYPKALESYKQALEIQRAEQDIAGQADTLGQIGLLYVELGESQKATELLAQALELQRQRGDRHAQVEILRNIGLLYTELSEKQKALDCYNQALELLQAEQENQPGRELTFNRTQQGSILTGIAVTYYSVGDYQEALAYFNQVRAIGHEVGNLRQEAEALHQIGFAHDSLGEKQKALDSLNTALIILHQMGARDREAFTLREIAGIHANWGEPQQALNSYNQALKICRQAKSRFEEAVTLNDIAGFYHSLGAYKLSIDTYNSALDLFLTTGNRSRVASTLSNIGDGYRSAGDCQKALEYYNQALAIEQEVGAHDREVSTLTSIVRAYESLKDYDRALDAAKQILSLSQVNKNQFWEATAFVMMGKVYLAVGNYQNALDVFTQAAAKERLRGVRLGEANILGNIGKVYAALQQPQEALNIYKQKLDLLRALGDRAGEADTLYNIATVERNQENLEVALSQIEAVIEIIESLRTKVASQELRTSYFASKQDYYQFYIDLLMQLHKQQPDKGYDALAIQASERARARSLVDLLTEANADIRSGVEPKLLEKERSLQHQLHAFEKCRLQLLDGNYTQVQAAAIARKIETLLAQYREVQAQIRATSPHYAALTQPQPITLAEIQQQVLDDDTLLLEYSLGDERSYLWAVTKTGITSYQLPKRADIEAAAQRFSYLLKTPSYHLGAEERTLKVVEPIAASTVEPAAARIEVATQLSEMLLVPVAGQLKKNRLLIVSDGALQYVPFAVIPIPETLAQPVGVECVAKNVPLLVEHEIISLPSVSTIAVLRREYKGRKPAPLTVAVLADPVFERNDPRVQQTVVAANQLTGDTGGINNISLAARALERARESLDLEKSARESRNTFNRLPGTRKEAEQILQLLPASARMQAFDFAADRATATNPDLARYQIVHFATHGILNSTNPELSGVVLSLVNEQGMPQNGFLQLHDVFNLNLSAELVVLSACETGLGQEIKGEGLVGLTRGFMYAGSPGVLVSLWNVDDDVTALLMTKFYQGMLEKDLTPAAALRGAQIEMWQQQQWQAPYYWGAFVLQGEWK